MRTGEKLAHKLFLLVRSPSQESHTHIHKTSGTENIPLPVQLCKVSSENEILQFGRDTIYHSAVFWYANAAVKFERVRCRHGTSLWQIGWKTFLCCGFWRFSVDKLSKGNAVMMAIANDITQTESNVVMLACQSLRSYGKRTANSHSYPIKKMKIGPWGCHNLSPTFP